MTEEDRIQIACARYLDAVLAEGVLWWHTPNGGSRNAIEGAKLKRMGVKPGVPDIAILWRGGVVFVELKTATGRLTRAQTDMRDALEAASFGWSLCRSVDELESALIFHRVPIKARR